MQTFMVAKITKPSATIEDWVSLLRRSKIPGSRNGNRIIHFLVGSGEYKGNDEYARHVCCWFDPSSKLFERIEFMNVTLSNIMPRIKSDVRVSEWEKLFSDSKLYSARRQRSVGGRYSRRTVYWLETPVAEYTTDDCSPLCIYYDRSGTEMYGIRLIKDSK